MDVQQLERLNQLGDTLEALLKPLRIAQYNVALNREEEAQKLFHAYAQRTSYNPQFTYLTPPSNWHQPLHSFLHQLQPSNNVWEQWLYEDVKQTLESMVAAESHDPHFITERTLRKYGPLSQELLKTASDILERSEHGDKPRTLSAEEAASVMRQALLDVGLFDWTVIVDPAMNARMSVRSIEKQVKVRADSLFTQAELTRLLVHEIGTHVFRSENGRAQPLHLLRFGFEGYLLTEEGLATYHEDQFGVRNVEDLRRYALRVLAAHLSLQQDFYAVFDAIAAYTSTDDAFEIVVRAKRGFTDTAVAGANLKDVVYLAGFIKVSAHLSASPEDYPLLMSGKVSIEMLDLLKALKSDGLLVEPRYLPQSLIR